MCFYFLLCLPIGADSAWERGWVKNLSLFSQPCERVNWSSRTDFSIWCLARKDILRTVLCTLISLVYCKVRTKLSKTITSFHNIEQFKTLAAMVNDDIKILRILKILWFFFFKKNVKILKISWSIMSIPVVLQTQNSNTAVENTFKHLFTTF